MHEEPKFLAIPGSLFKRKVALLMLFFLTVYLPIRAQNTNLKADSAGTEVTYNSWTIGTTYGNNYSFLGRNQANRLPFISADLTYKSKQGFWLSAMGYHILNTPSRVDEVDLMAGWDFDISDKLDASISYSRFFFSPQSELIKAATANTFSTQAGLDWNYLYSRLNFTYIFGGASDVFLILDNSRYFQLDKVLHPAGFLSIEPKISVIAGTQTFAETHIINRNNPLPVSGGGPGKGKGKPGGSGLPAQGNNGSSSTTTTITTTSFNVLNYEGSVPITYTLNNVSLEVSLRYSIPVNLLEGDMSRRRFFCFTSLYYTLR
jgi:hypothetical protein